MALALFGLTVAKMFTVDLLSLDGVYRIVGFIALGVTLLRRHARGVKLSSGGEAVLPMALRLDAVLNDLGYGDVIVEFEKINKWYA